MRRSAGQFRFHWGSLMDLLSVAGQEWVGFADLSWAISHIWGLRLVGCGLLVSNLAAG